MYNPPAMSGQLACVILAAGRSTRFKSSKSKLLHELAGRPLVEWALDTLLQLDPAQIVIVYGAHSSELTTRYSEGYRGKHIDFVLQDPPLGTAHALAQVETVLRPGIDNLVVLPGDAPLMTVEHLRELSRRKAQLRCDHVVISAEVPNPYGYGRVVRDPDNPDMVAMIVEESDASAEKKLLREINSSMYLFSSDVFEHLRVASELIGRSAVKGEYYLTDVARVSSMGAYMIDDSALIEGLNDRLQLARMDALVQQRLRERWMTEGVSFILPETSYLHSDIQLGQDVVVGPQCYLAHGTSVGEGTVLQQGCHLDACTVGSACNLLHVHAHEAVIGNHVRIGPYANLRPGTVLEDDVRVGNFVETKKAHVGRGSKLPHLSYVGDATIGVGCNIGAGTIFCNYDGINKHHTTLGDGVFVGSNSSLQAPLSIGDGAFVAMASAVTRDVPSGALAVGRARQENKPGYVERLRRRQAGEADPPSEDPVVEQEVFESVVDNAAAETGVSEPADLATAPAPNQPDAALEMPFADVVSEPATAPDLASQPEAEPEPQPEAEPPTRSALDPSPQPTSLPGPQPHYGRLSVEQVQSGYPDHSGEGELIEPLQLPEADVVIHAIEDGQTAQVSIGSASQLEELAEQMSDSVLGGAGSLGTDPGFSGSIHSSGYVPDGLVIRVEDEAPAREGEDADSGTQEPGEELR